LVSQNKLPQSCFSLENQLNETLEILDNFGKRLEPRHDLDSMFSPANQSLIDQIKQSLLEFHRPEKETFYEEHKVIDRFCYPIESDSESESPSRREMPYFKQVRAAARNQFIRRALNRKPSDSKKVPSQFKPKPTPVKKLTELEQLQELDFLLNESISDSVSSDEDNTLQL
jgi:hypothetical protein